MDKFLFLGVQLMLLTLVACQPDKVREVCRPESPDHCYTLYRYTDTGVSWYQAKQMCSTSNQHLAALPDQATQDLVAQLIQPETGGGAWTAGQVRNDDVWRRLDGTSIPDVSWTRNTPGNCGELLVTGSPSFVLPDRCIFPQFPLCAKSLPVSGCPSGDAQLGSFCYRRLNTEYSWYEATSECRKIGYELARYDPAFLGYDMDEFGTPNTGTLWLDIYSYPWVWNIGSASPASMTYFNWNKDHGTNTPDRCMYIYSSGVWRADACNHQASDVKFFICEKESGTATSSIPAADTTIAGVTPAAADDDGDDGDGELLIFGMPFYITVAAVIAGLLLIIIIIVVAVLCSRWYCASSEDN